MRRAARTACESSRSSSARIRFLPDGLTAVGGVTAPPAALLRGCTRVPRAGMPTPQVLPDRGTAVMPRSPGTSGCCCSVHATQTAMDVRLQRDVPVLAARPRLLLRQCGLEGVDQHRPRAARLDHVVDAAPLGGSVWVGEALAGILEQLLPPRCRAVALRLFLAEVDVAGAFRPQPRHRPGAPGEVEAAADLLGALAVVGAAGGLPGKPRQLRRRCPGVGVKKLCPVPDDPAPLLS